MEKEVVDFLHQSIKISVWLVAHPREHVVDRLFEAVFELCSERRGFRDESLRDARFWTKAKETVGEHLKVPVATGTVRITYLAISQAQILLRVLEERLYSPPIGVAPNDMGRRSVDLVRCEVLDRVFLVLVSDLLGDHQPDLTSLRHRQRLRPDLVRLLVDLTLFLLDALFQRIDAHLLVCVGHLPVAPKRTEPVLPVGFDVFDQP